MKCPHCGSTKFKVTNVWLAGEIIRRRHRCAQCGRIFHSRETLDGPPPRGRPPKFATGSNYLHSHVKNG